MHVSSLSRPSWNRTRRPLFTRGRCVRETTPRYEDEGSVRESRGAVSVQRGAWWSAALDVPINHHGPADDRVQLRLERHGAAMAGQASEARVDLVIRLSELDAVVALVAGVVQQARRDGVLP